jgi:uncharacterized protein involved in exopolysaccharide biosynthesis
MDDDPSEHEVPPSKSRFTSNFNKRWLLVLGIAIVLGILAYFVWFTITWGPMGAFRPG